MKTDKVFILMLVIMLPLTGCIDVSDNADAQDASDSEEAETTVINNYYNNTTTIIQPAGPEVISHYILPDGNLTLSFDGTFTYRLEDFMRNTTGGSSTAQWNSGNTLSGVSMTCDGVMIVEGLYIYAESFLPVLPDQICIIEIDRSGSNGDIVIFTEHPLA